jgi:phage terminase large subunit
VSIDANRNADESVGVNTKNEVNYDNANSDNTVCNNSGDLVMGAGVDRVSVRTDVDKCAAVDTREVNNIRRTSITLPSSFLPLFDETKRYFCFYGGRGGGKSESVARILVYRALRKPLTILCLRKIQRSLDHSTYDTVCSVIRNLIETFPILESKIEINRDFLKIANGSKFIFRGLSTSTDSSIKSFNDVDICWVEEASDISKSSLDILLPTIRKENSQIVFTYNRKFLNDPVHTTLAVRNRPNTVSVEVNYYDNPFFPKVLEEERLRSLEEDSESLYRKIWLGVPFSEEEVLIGYDLLEKNKYFTSTNCDLYNIDLGVDVARYGND